MEACCGTRMCGSYNWNPNLKLDVWDSEFGLQLSGHNDFTEHCGLQATVINPSWQLVLFQWYSYVGSSRGTFSGPLLVKFTYQLIGKKFVSNLNSSIPYALISSSQWPVKVVKESKLLHWESPLLKMSTNLSMAHEFPMDVLCVSFSFLASEQTRSNFLLTVLLILGTNLYLQ